MLRIKELREKKLLSQNEVANAIDTSAENINKWENGIEEPSASHLVKLAEYFGCSVDYLLGSTTSNPQTPTSAPKIESSPQSSNDEGGLIKFLGITIVIFLIIMLIIATYPGATNGCSDNSGTASCEKIDVFSRQANNSDITIDSQYSFPYYINLKIRPNCDIKDLQITIYYYDKNHNLLTTEVETVGDVAEGNQYNLQIDLLSRVLETALKIDSASFSVTGGTVSRL